MVVVGIPSTSTWFGRPSISSCTWLPWTLCLSPEAMLADGGGAQANGSNKVWVFAEKRKL